MLRVMRQRARSNQLGVGPCLVVFRHGTTFLPLFLLLAATNVSGGPQTPIQRKPQVKVSPAVVQVTHVPVPDLQGLTLVEAGKQLADAELQLGDQTDGVGIGKLGTIIDQEPKAHLRAMRGSKVNVVLLRRHPQPTADAGPALTAVPGLVGRQIPDVTVPRVRGLTLVEAEKRLGSERLSLGAVTERQDQADAGTVVEQTPKAGTFRPAGSGVDLVLSSGLVVRPGQRENPSVPVTGVYAVNLRADKARAEKNEVVVFTATLEPAFPAAEYKFVFGDRSESEWSGSAVSRHAYRANGSHEAYVVARVGRGPFVSSTRVPLEVGGVIPWGLIAVAGVLIAAAGLAFREWRKRPKPEEIDPRLVSFRAHVDPGRQEVETVSSGDAGPAVVIRAVPALGTQTVEMEEKPPELRKAAYE